jgi:hypothetical protein
MAQGQCPSHSCYCTVINTRTWLCQLVSNEAVAKHTIIDIDIDGWWPMKPTNTACVDWTARMEYGCFLFVDVGVVPPLLASTFLHDVYYGSSSSSSSSSIHCCRAQRYWYGDRKQTMVNAVLSNLSFELKPTRLFPFKARHGTPRSLGRSRPLRVPECLQDGLELESDRRDTLAFRERGLLDMAGLRDRRQDRYV